MPGGTGAHPAKLVDLVWRRVEGWFGPSLRRGVKACAQWSDARDGSVVGVGEPSPRGSGPEVYEGLRRSALDAVSGLPLPTPRADHSRVSGVVVDIPARGAFVTVVAMTDDSTSAYNSVGGGMIGMGNHAAVAAATHGLLRVADEQHDRFTLDGDTSHPPPGYVRIFVLTPLGRRWANVLEDAFWGKATDPLTPVIAAVQAVMTAMRQVDRPADDR